MLIQQGKWRLLRGKAFGLELPCLIGTIHINPKQQFDGQLLYKLLADKLNISTLPAAKNGIQPQDLVEALLFWLTHIQQHAHLPVFDSGQILNVRTRNDGLVQFQLAMPYYQTAATREILSWLCQTLNTLSAKQNVANTQLNLKQVDTSLTRLIAKLRRMAPSGSNTFRFLKAAHSLNIPWSRLTGNIFQFGHGKHCRWLDSSFTDQTPVISAGVARNKLQTSLILKKAGLPSPDSFSVNSSKTAQQFAAKLGFPVVIKPIDKDRGDGVTANLRDAVEVDKAYNHARKFSRKILVEKHIEGQDYRLTILNGQLIWAILRQPGGVVGNGRDTISTLLKQLNSDPQRQTHFQSPLKTLNFDDEAKVLLSEAGLTINSVPQQGQFIRLRSTANINNGGIPSAVLDKVHPDNQRLAEMAAKALKLDLAGVDLIIPDISQSWLKSGAGICEVNGQPQLGNVTNPQIYAQILTQLVDGNGRIPAILIINDKVNHDLANKIKQRWQPAEQGIAIASRFGVVIDDIKVSKANTFLTASNAALNQQDVSALIMVCSAEEILKAGLAIEQYDLVIMRAGSGSAPSSSAIKACQMCFAHQIGSLFINQKADQLAQVARQSGITKISYYATGDTDDSIAEQAISQLSQSTHY